MENISWAAHATNEDVLHRVKEERNILHIIKKGRLTGWSNLVLELSSKTYY